MNAIVKQADKTLETRQVSLMSALNADVEYIQNLTRDIDPEDFKGELQELAGNDYLMKMIPPNQIVRVAAQAASMGLSINKTNKECYILPFNVKGQGMVPSIVISKNGLREMAFRDGFFFDIDPVWNNHGQAVRQTQMSLQDQAGLEDSDKAYVIDNLLGWYFSIKDLSEDPDLIKVPFQETFVSLTKAMAVTKDMDAPDHSIVNAYVHKAARQAAEKFFIPRKRGNSFRKMVQIDDSTVVSTQEPDSSVVNLVPDPKLSKPVVVDTDSIMADIKVASADRLTELFKTINLMPKSEARSALIEAYKLRHDEITGKVAPEATPEGERKPAPQRRSDKKSPEVAPRPKFAVFEDKIRDAITEQEIKNLVMQPAIAHLTDEMQDELRVIADQAIADLSE